MLNRYTQSKMRSVQWIQTMETYNRSIHARRLAQIHVVLVWRAGVCKTITPPRPGHQLKSKIIAPRHDLNAPISQHCENDQTKTVFTTDDAKAKPWRSVSLSRVEPPDKTDFHTLPLFDPHRSNTLKTRNRSCTNARQPRSVVYILLKRTGAPATINMRLFDPDVKRELYNESKT